MRAMLLRALMFSKIAEAVLRSAGRPCHTAAAQVAVQTEHVEGNPVKRVLLATNFSPASLFALKRALLLARLHNAVLSIVHVCATDVDADRLARHVKKAVAELERDLEDDFGAGFRPTSVERVKGEVGEGIASAAYDMKADLIVAGLSEKLSGAIDGTLLEHLLIATRVPLLIIKGNPRHNYERVLVELDLAPASGRVLEAALHIAFTADFAVVHANEAEGDEADIRKAINDVVRQSVRAAHCEGRPSRRCHFC